ncbi:MAG: hypothetical protein MSL26_10450 [Clostridiales bacterium]|nr:hypothetical protein [Clostridiales bacterium]
MNYQTFFFPLFFRTLFARLLCGAGNQTILGIDPEDWFAFFLKTGLFKSQAALDFLRTKIGCPMSGKLV